MSKCESTTDTSKNKFIFYYFKAESDLDNWLDSMWDLLNFVNMPFCLNAIIVNVYR
jgi:hypothetical protein